MNKQQQINKQANNIIIYQQTNNKFTSKQQTTNLQARQQIYKQGNNKFTSKQQASNKRLPSSLKVSDTLGAFFRDSFISISKYVPCEGHVFLWLLPCHSHLPLLSPAPAPCAPPWCHRWSLGGQGLCLKGTGKDLLHPLIHLAPPCSHCRGRERGEGHFVKL